MTDIEKVARALCDDAGCVWDMDPQSLSRAEWRKAACAAIAAMQPAPQEPVAWNWREIAKAAGKHGIRYRTNDALAAFLTDIAPLYAHPPAPQEPVAWMYERAGVRVCMEERRPNYTLPAMGFTEHALGIIPTPPAGGSDAE